MKFEFSERNIFTLVTSQKRVKIWIKTFWKKTIIFFKNSQNMPSEIIKFLMENRLYRLWNFYESFN